MLIALITTSNEEEAVHISRTLVEERLIACANRIPVRSMYRWKGKIENDQEVMLICKTTEEHLDKLIKRIKELHSYDVPEIVAIPVVGGSDDYIKWVEESTRP